MAPGHRIRQHQLSVTQRKTLSNKTVLGFFLTLWHPWAVDSWPTYENYELGDKKEGSEG